MVQVVPSQASSLLSREQLERPQSAINTTRALVRCYNKLLWFGAEIGPVSNTFFWSLNDTDRMMDRSQSGQGVPGGKEVFAETNKRNL